MCQSGLYAVMKVQDSYKTVNELSKLLGVSRNATWKNLARLNKFGFLVSKKRVVLKGRGGCIHYKINEYKLKGLRIKNKLKVKK